MFVLARLSPSFSLNQVAVAKTAVASGPIEKQLSPPHIDRLLGHIKGELGWQTSSKRLYQQHVYGIGSGPYALWIPAGCI